MTKPLLSRSEYGPPEHFDDKIRAYQSEARNIPTPLENLLFELAGHSCSICRAPWLEVHHIEELGEGGRTEYANLIVLCPNCHTRVHATGVPSKQELMNYKSKQEIAYELPVLAKLTLEENAFVAELSAKTVEDQLIYSKRIHREVPATSQDEAVEKMRKDVGFLQLQESGMVAVDLETPVTLDSGMVVSVALRVRLTGKGVKWLRYLQDTGRVPAR
jgi:hypothetical protein